MTLMPTQAEVYAEILREADEAKKRADYFDKRAEAFEKKNNDLMKANDALIQALFRLDPDSAVRTLAEDLHYIPEEVQRYRERFAS